MKSAAYFVMALWVALWFAQTVEAGSPKRSRAEGLPGIEASNTVGLGDIWLSAGSEALFRVDPVSSEQLLGLVDSTYQGDLSGLLGTGVQNHRELRALPHLQASLGLAHFLQFSVDAVPWDGNKLGTTAAWLKCTTPGNDKLRMFGVAVAFGVTLSTEEDIYSRSVSTPGFEPFFHALVAADVDFLGLNVSFPLKAYFNYANFDDQRLVHAYEQHKFQLALEWKDFQGGPFLRWSTQLYRRLPTRFDPHPADPWMPLFHEMGMGWRWTAGDRFTFTAEGSFDPLSPAAFYRDPARKPPRARLEVSLPLLAQETQSEAMRAVLFTESRRRKLREAALHNPAGNVVSDSGRGSKTPGGLPVDLDALSLGQNRNDKAEGELLRNVLGDQEKETLERRQKIRAELKEIEDLLP